MVFLCTYFFKVFADETHDTTMFAVHCQPMWKMATVEFLSPAKANIRCLLLNQTEAFKIYWEICCLATNPTPSVVCIILAMPNQHKN